MTPEAGGLRASESAGAGLGSRDRCPGPAVAGACCRPGRRTAGSYGLSLRPRAAPPAARGPGRRRSGPGPGPWQLVTQAAFTAAARLTRRRRARWPVPGGVGGGRRGSAAGSRGAVSAGMASAGNRRHGDRRPRLAHRRQAARARVTRTRSRCTVPGSGPARRRAQPPAAAGVELSQPRPLSSSPSWPPAGGAASLRVGVTVTRQQGLPRCRPGIPAPRASCRARAGAGAGAAPTVTA